MNVVEIKFKPCGQFSA